MNLLELIDHLMHTTTIPESPAAPDPHPSTASQQTRAQVDRTWQTLHELDAAVELAEARLRARGAPIDEDPPR